METWKKNLNQALSRMNVYSFTEWNARLDEWIREYATALGIYDNIHVKVEGKNQEVKLTIKVHHEKPFIIFLKYAPDGLQGEPVLFIRYTKCYNVEKQGVKAWLGKADPLDAENELQFYDWAEDNIDFSDESYGPTADLPLKKEFVQETITIKFKSYMETRGYKF